MANSLNRMSTKIKHFLQTFWWHYFYFTLGVSFFLFYPLLMYLVSKPKRRHKAYLVRSRLAEWFLWLHGVRIRKVGNPEYPVNRPIIVCSNHFSEMDILVLLVVFRGEFAFLGKQELADMPLFGKFFKALDVAVDRKNPHKSSNSYKLALNRLSNGQNIIIFPEGGIFKNVPELNNFKIGAFNMAHAIGSPILPVAIKNSWRVLHPYDRTGYPGIVTVQLFPVIKPENLEPAELKAQTHEVIKSGLEH